MNSANRGWQQSSSAHIATHRPVCQPIRFVTRFFFGCTATEHSAQRWSFARNVSVSTGFTHLVQTDIPVRPSCGAVVAAEITSDPFGRTKRSNFPIAMSLLCDSTTGRVRMSTVRYGSLFPLQFVAFRPEPVMSCPIHPHRDGPIRPVRIGMLRDELTELTENADG